MDRMNILEINMLHQKSVSPIRQNYFLTQPLAVEHVILSQRKILTGGFKMKAFQNKWGRLKVALCHDWLTGMRGGERVLELLCRAFPDAPVYTLIHNRAAISDTINSHDIVTSPLQRIPGIERHYRRFLPLFPAAMRSIRPARAELLISTSHCVAKGLRPPEGARHLCYCFTPMRYAWLFYEEYFGTNLLKKFALKPVLSALRTWDRSSSASVDRFVTLSLHVQRRIHDFYRRESDIVYPPVNTGFWTPCPEAESGTAGSREPFDLVVSALTPYKRIDLPVHAYSRTGRRLVIAGVGSEEHRLRAAAAPNIEFTGWLPDERIRDLYRECRMLIFPGEEDFGIVPLEAMACGRPVAAYARGGALETVKNRETGVLFHEQTEDALIRAVEQCSSTKWDSAAIRAHAERFGQDAFLLGLSDSMEKCLRG